MEEKKDDISSAGQRSMRTINSMPDLSHDFFYQVKSFQPRDDNNELMKIKTQVQIAMNHDEELPSKEGQQAII